MCDDISNRNRHQMVDKRGSKHSPKNSLPAEAGGKGHRKQLSFVAHFRQYNGNRSQKKRINHISVFNIIIEDDPILVSNKLLSSLPNYNRRHNEM